MRFRHTYEMDRTIYQPSTKDFGPENIEQTFPNSIIGTGIRFEEIHSGKLSDSQPIIGNVRKIQAF